MFLYKFHLYSSIHIFFSYHICGSLEKSKWANRTEQQANTRKQVKYQVRPSFVFRAGCLLKLLLASKHPHKTHIFQEFISTIPEHCETRQTNTHYTYFFIHNIILELWSSFDREFFNFRPVISSSGVLILYTGIEIASDSTKLSTKKKELLIKISHDRYLISVYTRICTQLSCNRARRVKWFFFSCRTVIEWKNKQQINGQ